MVTRSRLDQAQLKISLAAASLMFALPFLNPNRYAPMPAFYAEWWAAALLLIAGVILLSRETWMRPLIPKIVLLPAGLMALALLQWVLGQGGEPEFLIFFMLYLLGAAFAMTVGQSLRQTIGLTRLAQALATFLLMGSLASALIATLSKFAPQVLPSLIINSQDYGVARGNMMQPNHLANYLWTGITAACFLHLSRRFSSRWLIAAVAPLLLVAMMTSSRSPMIYLTGLNLLALLWWFRARSLQARRWLRVTLLLVPGFLLAQALSPAEFVTPVGRMSNDFSELIASRDAPITTTSIKILESKIALAMFVDKPWLGNGIHSYAWGSFVLAEQFPSSLQGHAENAHNLFTHLLAELGMGGVLVLVTVLSIWWRGVAAQKWTPAHLWLLSVLMIEAWHSMVEYPLWYSFFLLPTALLLGALDSGAVVLRPSLSLRGASVALLLVGAVVLHNLRSDYLRFEYALYPGLEKGEPNEIARSFGEITPDLLDLHRHSLLSPYVGLIYAMNMVPTRDLLQEKLIITDRAMHFYPFQRVVINYALLLALAGRQEDALQQLRWAIRGYPDMLPELIGMLQSELSEDPSLPFRTLLHAAEAEVVRRTNK